jgi:hypothetical protein
MPAYADAARVSRAAIPARASLAIPAATGDPPSSLVLWYVGLIPYWLAPESPVVRRLLLRTHEWILDRVLAPGVDLEAAAQDLAPGGPLTSALMALAEGDAAGAEWRHFALVVVANLRHALLLPVARRNEAWLRWLFLIPYSVRPKQSGAPRRTAADG